MMSRVLAFDLGASSGRAMLGTYVDGRIEMEELHRFTNDPVMVNGTLYWDTLRLFYHIKQGITAAVNRGGFDSIGIDTWGVDFGLIGPDGQMVANPVHYRDRRTDCYRDGTFSIPVRELYAKTGIENMTINTLYQLDAMGKSSPDTLERADKLLFTPDLLNYFLCGEMKSEYTIASTAQMLNAKSRDWDREIIARAGIPGHLLCDIVQPGTVCGQLSDEICEELGAPKADVVCIASHDTASAVAAVPTQEKEFIFISCGTWSLLGTETDQPVLSEKAFQYNFTNEGGVDGKICFLKNIMGTWLIQESRRQWIREGKEYGFGELEQMAAKSRPFQALIDVDDAAFSKPGNLPRRIRAYCERTGQQPPETPGDVIRCIDESLAAKFGYTVACMEACTGIGYRNIHMLGGGTKSALLCQMTADAAQKAVIAGPDEATAYGNIAIQLLARGELDGMGAVRSAVEHSCRLKRYEPQAGKDWEEAKRRLVKIAGLKEV